MSTKLRRVPDRTKIKVPKGFDIPLLIESWRRWQRSLKLTICGIEKQNLKKQFHRILEQINKLSKSKI